MMKNFHYRKVIEVDGEISIYGLPFKKGQIVEMVLRPVSYEEDAKPVLTAGKLLTSGLPGIWAGRWDIKDSSAFAHRLRDQAQNRTRL